MSSGAASRLLLVKKNSTTLLGVSAKTITAGSESIDVTTDEDLGFRCLLDVAGVETLDISGSGVTKDELLRQLALTGGSKLLTDITIEYPPVGTQTTGDTIAGDFYFGGFTETGGGSDGAIQFDFTMMSSGAWTLTPGTTP
jgi:predicted secreted protein